MTEIHNLKCWTRFFREIELGNKKFDIRKNDRGYQVGDGLKLWEWDPDTKTYSARYFFCRISYVLDDPNFGLQPGYVCLSLDVGHMHFGVAPNASR